MTKLNDILTGTSNMIDSILGDNAIENLGTTSRRLLNNLISVTIGDFNNFNAQNYTYMNYHMLRNLYEKEITLNNVGENAYPNGNPEINATYAQHPNYTNGNNYTDYQVNTIISEKKGDLSTSIGRLPNSNLFNTQNLYLDSDSGFDEETPASGGNTVESGLVSFSGDSTDRNSILYKTKKLIRQNKINTIISKFHTAPGMEYNGQVRSKFGESHGRNLLTKKAEQNDEAYTINGFDNPYCRVWTHHYKYDRLAKTMRAKSGGMNYWGEEFEWNDDDIGHGKDETKYGDGERYDYAWRGEHNQARRQENSVLDTETGLVKITPQYRGGRQNNRHTKECMFSIENLAWKDYDPYSFEQALSWEQRGPFGGRIMWFPPYGIEIQENASARWNQNDFIGRGESVYTYVNSERTGTLSFYMLTDHPSSIDYASWWDDNTMIEGVDGEGNSENDYLRYFAGCANGSVSPNGSGSGDPDTDGNRMMNEPDGLIKKPTPYTDEYLAPSNNGKESPKEKPTETPIPQNDVKNPDVVEFFVFYPNNYSGILDAPSNPKSNVNSIAYLLAGRNGQKTIDNSSSLPIDSYLPIESMFEYGNDLYIGYEMGYKNGITTDDCDARMEFVQGGNSVSTKQFDPVEWKKWRYRIDHLQPYTPGNTNPENTINQKIKEINLNDKKSFKTNLDVSNNDRVKGMSLHSDSLYSFAEVAAALYSPNLLNVNSLYIYLQKCGVNQERVDKLIELFTNKDRNVEKFDIVGLSSSHDVSKNHTKRNDKLALNRANNILNWLHTNTVSGWDKVEGNITTKPGESVDNSDINSVDGESAKLYRSAHVIITFSNSTTVAETQTEPEVEQSDDGSVLYQYKKYNGFKYLRSELQQDGSVWNYYEKDNTTVYYEQTANGESQQRIERKNVDGDNIWVDKNTGELVKLINSDDDDVIERFNAKTGKGDWNKLRYDQEYHFYKQYFADHATTFDKLQEKIKYFNPAFHSMTPEGFNARLTFLQQCTRQGNTKTMSDIGGKTANNLAFGRPPYCILRLGDFYNQMIVIDTVSINYNVSNGLQWDLNTEGNGVQPMLCQVSINFKFIGGGDITGPVQRLQNAMSFNYYANTSFYDNRADRVQYQDTDWKTMGGAGNNEINTEKSYAFTAKQYEK